MKEYVQSKMVNWFWPKILIHTGIKSLISETFGNYADRREMQAALENNSEEEWKKLEKKYCQEQDEIWIDLVCDTGDGFNSTFAIAKTVAQKELSVKMEEPTSTYFSTKRGKILVLGGDMIYPFPTAEAYFRKFKVPFESACDTEEFIDDEEAGNTEEDNRQPRPDLYAIPGNHDWYDGLGNFIKLFCQKRRIGLWQTQQQRSYFALPLPNHYWLWATDIQLNSDIDAPQLQYFTKVAKERMKEGDTVILVTAEPAWVYNQLHASDRSFERLEFFVDMYIYDKYKEIGKKFKLAATLTGDLHHYSRYSDAKKPNGHQYITAGGGGAFLHLTHNLPQQIKAIKEGDIHLQKTFPNQEDSKRLLGGNFAFPIKNFLFCNLLVGLHFLFFWLLQSNGISETKCTLSVVGFGCGLLKSILYSPGLTLLFILYPVGFYAFTDTKVNRKGTRWIGALHGFIQLAFLFFCMYITCSFVPQYVSYLGWRILLTAFLLIFSGMFSGFIFGAYLYLTNRFLGMHIDEASSSLISPDYKNFLRLHVYKDGITIYPIGIPTVPTDWKQHCENEELHFTGNQIHSFLIETPIQILNKNL